MDNNKEISKGGIGELVIRGPHLMKGYLNNIEETNKSLRNNPIFPEQNEKVLFTGDLVRVVDQGKYIFMGRLDDQVKSGGYRIELGEVEIRIGNYMGVKEVCIIAVKDKDINYKIKCFIQLKHGYTLEQVKDYCQKNLTLYTIPHVWCVLDCLPKLYNGKIDKSTLKQWK